MNYELKYYKYKSKYLELKANNQKGGLKNTFDIVMYSVI